MTLMKRNGNLFNSFPLFDDDFFSRDLFNWGLTNNSNTGTTIPAVNIKETADSFEVEMAAPGMTKNDFKIELDSNVLTITSEKQQEQEQNPLQQTGSRLQNHLPEHKPQVILLQQFHSACLTKSKTRILAYTKNPLKGDFIF